MLQKDLLKDLTKELPKNYQLIMIKNFKKGQLEKKIHRAEDEDEKKHWEGLLKVKKIYDAYHVWNNVNRKVIFKDRRHYKKLHDNLKNVHGLEHPETIDAKIGYIYSLQFPRDRKYIVLCQKLEPEKEIAKMEIYEEVKRRTLSLELQMRPLEQEMRIPGKMPIFKSEKMLEKKEERMARKEEKKAKKAMKLKARIARKPY